MLLPTRGRLHYHRVVEVGVLGTTIAVGPDGPLGDMARRSRAVLAALALEPGRAVTADRLVDLVWGEAPPPGAHGTLHAYLSTLRRVLEPGLAPRAPSSVIITSPDGYRLAAERVTVDAEVFAAEVREAHSTLGPLWSLLTTGRSDAVRDVGTVAACADGLEQALGRWRGRAFSDLGDHPDVVADRVALEELRATAQEDLLLGLLALGEHAAVVAAGEQTIRQDPLRERPRCIHALALLRAGRQAESLDALRGYGRLLDDELGLRPGPEVRGLEEAVLRQDPALYTSLTPAPVVVETPGQDRGPSRSSSPPHPRPPRPTVGREPERRALAAVLGSAAAGLPDILVAVGEPGIGKTRLVQDAVAAAREHGFTVAVARCSQDEGAPPLWPWYRILHALGIDRPSALTRSPDQEDDPGRAFAVQEALVDAVRSAAADRPVLLVVEDLHWADTRTLRALAHLTDSIEPGDRLAVLLTRRVHPRPTGTLLDLGAVLARRGARVVELGGLDLAQARELVASMGGDTSLAPVDAWCARTGGNPFFLVELTRLGLGGGGWQGTVPDSVRAVVSERLEDLPEETRDLLLFSAALGREHSPLLLARVSGWSADEADRLLEPARRIGTVHVRDDGLLAFEHALTRDAVAAAAPPGQLTRVHARIAQALQEAPPGDLTAVNRTFELARHWLAAGPVHAATAWRAAAAAALEARRDSANVEASELYAAALASQGLDPSATQADRYALLLAFTDVAARAARWGAAVEAVGEAVRLARSDEDPERVATAVAGLTRYNVWLPQSFGAVAVDLVEDLRSALRAAGTHDSSTRCQLMLALAVQLYYAAGSEPEIEALTDEALAMARRLGDPELRGWAARTAWLALWRPRYLDRRLELSREEIEAARQSGDEAAEAVARTALAGAAAEAADLVTWTTESAAAETIARRRRLPYVEFALGLVRLSLHLMSGQHEKADVLEARLREMRTEVTTPADDLLDFTLAFAAASWRPALAPAVAEQIRRYQEVHDDPFLLVGSLFQLTRAGRLEEVRASLARAPLPPVGDLWHSTMEAAQCADIAGRLADPALAAQAVDVLRAASGRMVVAGISLNFGPVDGYLAVALAVLGDVEGARRAATAAEALATTWGLSGYLGWLADRRQVLGL